MHEYILYLPLTDKERAEPKPEFRPVEELERQRASMSFWNKLLAPYVDRVFRLRYGVGNSCAVFEAESDVAGEIAMIDGVELERMLPLESGGTGFTAKDQERFRNAS